MPMPAEYAITVAVVDDHPVLRAGVARALENEGCTIVAEAETVEEGYDAVGRTRPHVAVVDISLGEESGVDLARRLLRRDSRLGVIIYTGSADPVALKDALNCGARGFAFKTSGSTVLVTAVRAVAKGGTFVDREIREQIARLERPGAERVLTDRQREILDLLSEGLSGDEVAARLALSPETVKTHVRAAMERLGAQNRTHAVVLGLRNQEIGL